MGKKDVQKRVLATWGNAELNPLWTDLQQGTYDLENPPYPCQCCARAEVCRAVPGCTLWRLWFENEWRKIRKMFGTYTEPKKEEEQDE